MLLAGHFNHAEVGWPMLFIVVYFGDEMSSIAKTILFKIHAKKLVWRVIWLCDWLKDGYGLWWTRDSELANEVKMTDRWGAAWLFWASTPARVWLAGCWHAAAYGNGVVMINIFLAQKPKRTTISLVYCYMKMKIRTMAPIAAAALTERDIFLSLSFLFVKWSLKGKLYLSLIWMKERARRNNDDLYTNLDNSLLYFQASKLKKKWECFEIVKDRDMSLCAPSLAN